MSKEKEQAGAAMAAMHTAIARHGDGSPAAEAAADQAEAAVIAANRAGVTFGEIEEETKRRL